MPQIVMLEAVGLPKEVLTLSQDEQDYLIAKRSAEAAAARAEA